MGYGTFGQRRALKKIQQPSHSREDDRLSLEKEKEINQVTGKL